MAITSSGVAFGIDFVLNDKFSSKISNIDRLYTKFATNVMKTAPLINKNINSTATAFDHLSRRISNSSKNISDSIKDVQKASKSLSSSMGQTAPSPQAGNPQMVTSMEELAQGADVIANAGMGVLNFLGEGVQTSMKFNAQISKVGSISGASAEQLEMLKQSAMEMGATTAFSASQAGQALEELSKAGYSPENAMKALNHTLNLAGAGGLALGQTADIVTDTLGIFGKTADDASWAIDILAKGANSASTTVPLLFESLKNFAGPVQALGVSLEETTAMVGALANLGFKGSVATNSMATAMGRLAKPTKEMQRAISATNFQVFDSQGKFKGLAGMIEEVEKATAKMNPKQRLAFLTTMFGAEAVGQMTSLLNTQYEVMENGEKVMLKGSKAIKAQTKAMEEAGGTAQRIADQNMDNLQGNVLRFQSAWEGMMISIGDALEPVVNEIVLFGTKVVGVFDMIAKSSIGSVLLHIIGLLAGLAVAIGTVAGAYWSMKLAVIAITPVLKAFGIVAWASLLPLIKVIAVIGAVIAVLYGLYKWFQLIDKATGIFTKMAGIIKIFTQAWSSFNEVTGEFKIEDMSEQLGMSKESLLKIGAWASRFKSLWLGITQAIGDAWTNTKAIVGNFIDFFQDFVNNYRKEFDALGIPIADLVGSLEDWKDTGILVGKVIVAGLIVIGGTFALVMASIVVVVGVVIGIMWSLYKSFLFIYDLISILLIPLRTFWDILVGLKDAFQAGADSGWQISEMFKAFHAQIADSPLLKFVQALIEGFKVLTSEAGSFGDAITKMISVVGKDSAIGGMLGFFGGDDEESIISKALSKTQTNQQKMLGSKIADTEAEFDKAGAGSQEALGSKLGDLQMQQKALNKKSIFSQLISAPFQDTPEAIKAQQADLQQNKALQEGVTRDAVFDKVTQIQTQKAIEEGNLSPLQDPSVGGSMSPIVIQTMLNGRVVAEEIVEDVSNLQGDNARLTNEQ